VIILGLVLILFAARMVMRATLTLARMFASGRTDEAFIFVGMGVVGLVLLGIAIAVYRAGLKQARKPGAAPAALVARTLRRPWEMAIAAAGIGVLWASWPNLSGRMLGALGQVLPAAKPIIGMTLVLGPLVLIVAVYAWLVLRNGSAGASSPPRIRSWVVLRLLLSALVFFGLCWLPWWWFSNAGLDQNQTFIIGWLGLFWFPAVVLVAGACAALVFRLTRP
jgi:hypothetical protein